MSTSSSNDTERFWSAHLAAIEQCGMSVAEYAREHDLSAQSLYGWRRRLSGSSSSTTPFAEVLVTPVPAPAVPAAARESAIALTLRLGTARLAFSELPSAAWLAELLAAPDPGR